MTVRSLDHSSCLIQRVPWFEYHGFADIWKSHIYTKFNAMEQIKLSIVCKAFVELFKEEKRTLHAFIAIKSCYCGHLDRDHDCDDNDDTSKSKLIVESHDWRDDYVIENVQVEKIGFLNIYNKLEQNEVFIKLFGNREVVASWCDRYNIDSSDSDDSVDIEPQSTILTNAYCIDYTNHKIGFIKRHKESYINGCANRVLHILLVRETLTAVEELKRIIIQKDNLIRKMMYRTFINGFI